MPESFDVNNVIKNTPVGTRNVTFT